MKARDPDGCGDIAVGHQSRCYHGLRRCEFCRFPPTAQARHRLRCACCGRFVKARSKVLTLRADHCPTCTDRGFVALTLFAAA